MKNLVNFFRADLSDDGADRLRLAQAPRARAHTAQPDRLRGEHAHAGRFLPKPSRVLMGFVQPRLLPAA